MRDIALPSAVRVPALAERAEVLASQLDIAELQATLRGGTQEEILHVYVLPDDADLQRILSLFDVLRDHLKTRKFLSTMSAVEVGEAIEQADLHAYPIHVSFDVTNEGMHTLLLLFERAGFLTVHDVLRPVDVSLLLSLSEEENPAGIASLEQFLSLDLISYAREPKGARERLLASFSSPLFRTAFESVVASSQLSDIESMLGGELGKTLEEQKLLPLRFFTVEEAVVTPGEQGMQHLSLTLYAYTRH
jgi:hypothetical protein